ncbi:decarboxylase [Candidatus Woesearchaeota archaeon]|nr:decarboxylase [Candidatus Woesearchaeota archaeon]
MPKAKFILSRRKVLEQYNNVKQTADIVSYSSKTNQEVTPILERGTESMFSVHSANELKHISDKSRVIFLAQAWNISFIRELIGMGIRHFVVDNEADLDILLNFLGDNDVKINLLLRIRLRENTIRTEKYFVFGMDSDTVNKKIRELRGNKNILKLGIHFHRKTQNMSEWNIKYELCNILEKDVIGMIDLIDIGGGLPSFYANTNDDVIISIFDRIRELREWANNHGIKVIIEPGRYISAPAVRLVTRIMSIDRNNITVNASVYNSDMDALIVPVKLIVEGELSRDEGRPYVIKGMTPCSMDIFRYRAYLSSPKKGDELVFMNAGAYNFSSDFCDLEKIGTEVVE